MPVQAQVRWREASQPVRQQRWARLLQVQARALQWLALAWWLEQELVPEAALQPPQERWSALVWPSVRARSLV